VSSEDLAAELAALEAEDAEIEKRNADAALPQRIADQRRLNELKLEHGADGVCFVRIRGYRPGVATMVVALRPTGKQGSAYIKRFTSTVTSDTASNATKQDAQQQLAKPHIQYPHPERDKELFDATLDFAPLILNGVAAEIMKAATAQEKEAGK